MPEQGAYQEQKRTVYIVYGQNADEEKKRIEDFLKKQGLTVYYRENIIELVWEATRETIAATPFVGDMLTVAFKYVQAVIVLLTGEEKVRLCKDLQRDDDEEFEKIFCLQPTQEQIFEAGYAFGTSPMRTILVQIGDVRPFSDIAGRYTLHFAGTDEDYNLLHARLRLAGCIMEADSGASIVPLSSTVKEDAHTSPDPQKVFVVHGRNAKAKSAMCAFLRSLELTPIGWDQAVGFAKRGSAYTGEATVAGIDKAQAVVVLLTGDDLVELKKPDVMGQLLRHPQARPNVLFEAGIAFGRCKERTILVRLGNMRLGRDMKGLSMIKLANDSRGRLIERLFNAGCPVQIDGPWDRVGNFKVRPCSENKPDKPYS